MDTGFDSLTPLAADQRFEWSRGRSLHSGRPVLLKRLRTSTPSSAEVAALRRESALAADLPSLAALLPRWSDGPAMLFEDPGGLLASQAAGAGLLTIAVVLALGQHIATALGELHGRGLVHRGVRCDAILCRPEDGRAWLIDLADAAPSAHAVAPPTVTERLVYVAPEQTGRIDAAVDARSDLYALGIVLYELLTGGAPQGARATHSELEQIHWHIAGGASEPSSVVPSVPPVLSSLVMKLLAKNPDERYQSAASLAQDLATCAREWAAHGKITPFPLGRHDLGQQLVISSRLVGRERDVHLLLEAFESVCEGGRSGRGNLLLVEGYSGIGKTALIEQLLRPLVRRRGIFISGKFDQVVRGLPFGALIQAFRALVRQWLGQSEAELAQWRAALVQALGANGGVLAEVIPEIEFVIGPQASPPALGSTEAQNRFQRVLQSFVTVLAQPEHPLVLFLDDLQWADAATLDLLEPLLAADPGRSLLLIGAYRDNELDASPRLARSLGALAAAGVALQRVSLGPLLPADLTRLIAATLRSDAAHAEPLARLVHRKTDGNPFFVIQFLKLLEREGHLHFDPARLRWDYRIERIADAPLADNVVDLMARRIERLPAPTRQALTMAACIGNAFDIATLATVCEHALHVAETHLAPALAEGLLVGAATAPGEPLRYAFLHDRVQQAAYALISAEQRHLAHLTVGRLLQSRDAALALPPAERNLFDTVHHLNLGRTLIRDPQERRSVAALNLEAGRRARSATAYDTALELFQAGVELLGRSAWSDAPALAFDLHIEAAQALYLCSQFDPALAAYDALLEHARTPIERARVMRLRSVQYENLARYAGALASTREGLALLGLHLPQDAAAQDAALQNEIERIEQLLDGREIPSLIELPLMADASTRMVMAMLTDIWSAAYLHGSGTLARLASATMVRLSLQYGHLEESAYGYVTHAITVGPVRGDYAAAYQFGRLALAVNERLDDKRLRAKIYQQFHAHVNLWCQPLASCLPYAREACRSGLESGDFLYAAYGAGTEPWAAIAATEDLAQFVRDYEPSVALIEKLNNRGFADSVRLLVNWARALQGHTAAPLSLSDASLDETEYLRRYAGNAFFAGIHAAMRLHLCLLLGSPQQALQAAQHAAPLVAQMPGTIWPVLHEFWHGLALAANAQAMAPDAARAARTALGSARAAFDARALHCAENFAPQAWLLGAEIARLDGRDHDAAALYEQTIEFTAGRSLLQMQALAHELYGRARAARGNSHLARLHLAQARAGYARWNATAKVHAMQQQYPDLQPRRDGEAATAPGAAALPAPAMAPAGMDGLDLFSVLKAAQAIAGEVELDALLAQLLAIAIENAGAERGALVLEHEDRGASVHAIGGGEAGERGVALEQSRSVPTGIVNIVRRTGQTLVLADAARDELHGAEPYVQQHRPRALIGLPLLKSGRAIGVLYLEHRQVAGVFTAQRLSVLRVLAAQAAISLDNVRLFTAMRQEIDERQRAQTEVERLGRELEAENTYLRRDLIANVSHDLRTPLVSMRGYLEVLADKGDTLTTAQQHEYLGIAVRQSERLSTLIDELFELAKLDFKGATVAREPFMLAELAADVVAKFALAADRAQVALAIDAPAGLPFVDADLGLIERVLENLIGNALKHTPHGGHVGVHLSAQGDEVLTRITDTGCGIASDDLPFIFDRFYRGHEARRGGGAGLGLAIAKRILDLHGARIDVTSGAGGSCFSFALMRWNTPQH
jgi:predicted ATPase/signal transduction histidine kinase